MIVIEDGRITAVGADESRRPGTRRSLEQPELVAFPGFVEAHTHARHGPRRTRTSTSRRSSTCATRSTRSASTSRTALRSGITTINVQQGGELRDRRPGHGREALRHDDRGDARAARRRASRSRPRRSAASRARRRRRRCAARSTTCASYLEELVAGQEGRQGLRAARGAVPGPRPREGREARRAARWRARAWKVEDLEIDPARRDRREAGAAARAGRGQATRPSSTASGPATCTLALEVARENGFLARTTLVLDGDCWKAADVIAEAGVPVVLERDAGATSSAIRSPARRSRPSSRASSTKKNVRFALSVAEPEHAVALVPGRASRRATASTRKEALDAVTTRAGRDPRPRRARRQPRGRARTATCCSSPAIRSR